MSQPPPPKVAVQACTSAAAPAHAGVVWYDLHSVCVYCGADDFTCEYGPRNFILCSCCATKGAHVGCYEAAAGVTLSADFMASGSTWFCGEACEKVHGFLEASNGQRRPIRGEASEYTIEVAHNTVGGRGARVVVEAAMRIFKQCFDPLIMPNGQDLVTMCCSAYEPPDEARSGGRGSDSGGKHAGAAPDAEGAANDGNEDDGDDDDDEDCDYSGFRVVALRKGGMIISVATLRLFGTQLAEMPFVATRQGFQRAGHCRRLIKGIEDMLRSLQVSWLVLPSIRAVLPMWRYNFAFMPLTLQEQAALEPHIVSPDFESAQLVKKRMWPPPDVADSSRRGSGRARHSARGAGARRAAGVGPSAAPPHAAALPLPAGRGRQRERRGRDRARVRADGGGGGRRDTKAGEVVFRFSRRPRRTAAAAAAAALAAGTAASSSGAGDCSSSSSSGEERAVPRTAEEVKAAAAEAAWALEAAAAWQLFEAKGCASDASGSADGDAEWQGASGSGRNGTGAASSSSSGSDASDAGVVSEGDDGVVRSQRHQRGAQAKASKTAAGAAAGAGAAAPEKDQAGAVTAGAAAPTREEEAALSKLRRAVERAGGQLPGGWRARLVGQLPDGGWKQRLFTCPSSGAVHRSLISVKRSLGLAAPLPAVVPKLVTDGLAEGGGTHAGWPPRPGVAGCGADVGSTRVPAGNGAGRRRDNVHTAWDPERAAAELARRRAPSGAERLHHLRVQRAQRRLVADASVTCALADAVRRFYGAAAQQLAQPSEQLAIQEELAARADALQLGLDQCGLVATQQAASMQQLRAQNAALSAELEAGVALVSCLQQQLAAAARGTAGTASATPSATTAERSGAAAVARAMLDGAMLAGVPQPRRSCVQDDAQPVTTRPQCAAHRPELAAAARDAPAMAPADGSRRTSPDAAAASLGHVPGTAGAGLAAAPAAATGAPREGALCSSSAPSGRAAARAAHAGEQLQQHHEPLASPTQTAGSGGASGSSAARLSDGFLSALLPEVVARLMPTPPCQHARSCSTCSDGGVRVPFSATPSVQAPAAQASPVRALLAQAPPCAASPCARMAAATAGAATPLAAADVPPAAGDGGGEAAAELTPEPRSREGSCEPGTRSRAPSPSPTLLAAAAARTGAQLLGGAAAPSVPGVCSPHATAVGPARRLAGALEEQPRKRAKRHAASSAVLRCFGDAGLLEGLPGLTSPSSASGSANDCSGATGSGGDEAQRSGSGGHGSAAAAAPGAAARASGAGAGAGDLMVLFERVEAGMRRDGMLVGGASGGAAAAASQPVGVPAAPSSHIVSCDVGAHEQPQRSAGAVRAEGMRAALESAALFAFAGDLD